MESFFFPGPLLTLVEASQCLWPKDQRPEVEQKGNRRRTSEFQRVSTSYPKDPEQDGQREMVVLSGVVWLIDEGQTPFAWYRGAFPRSPRYRSILFLMNRTEMLGLLWAKWIIILLVSVTTRALPEFRVGSISPLRCCRFVFPYLIETEGSHGHEISNVNFK